MKRIGASLVLALLGLLVMGVPAEAKERRSSTSWTGADLYNATCARCHSARPPVERSDKQWKIIMGHMRLRANLTAEESKKILEYLQNSN